MTVSYNGWTASPHAADFGGLDNREVPGAPGVKLAPGVRAGDVATVMFSFAALFHAHVEPLESGTCWGYNYRPDTNNPKQLSCHASGTAIDLNAPKHPNGKRGTFTDQQVTMIRALLAGYDGVLEWGGDFTGVDDEMHFEIKGTAAAVAAMAAKLNGAPTPTPAPAATAHQWTGHDATGTDAGFRAHYGDEGPKIEAMQHELNVEFPAYSHLAEDGIYGDQTAAVLDEFSERAGHEAQTPAADRQPLIDSDGRDVGPRTARALDRHGVI